METQTCIVCGKYVNQWIFRKIISDGLAESWKLTKDLRRKFDLRESQFCPLCGNSQRTRILARAIMQKIPFAGTKYFSEWIAKANNSSITIAEINACGKLHAILTKNSNIKYSEYPSSRLLTRLCNSLKRVPQEDITRLSYPDNSFDLVLHSEVLEHVPDTEKALRECRRVLKPKGICLFTIPIILTRKTIQCAYVQNTTGEVIYRKLPSYHGMDNRKDSLVWWEFGYDIIKKYNMDIVLYEAEFLTHVLAIQKNQTKR